MVAKIHPAFWSNTEVEQLDAEGKLACLWLLTNSGTNILGVCKVSPRRFAFETGASPDALEKALKAMPDTFAKFGDTIFIRNYIRKQFGSGPHLKKNNVWKSLEAAFKGLRDESLREAICSEHPEFESTLEAPPKGVQSWSRPARERERERTGEREGEEAPTEPQWTESTGKARIALGYLGQKTGGRFMESAANLDPISERIFETGMDLDGIKKMIDRCVAMFKGDPVMEKCLTPHGLFKEKFHGYYGQRDMAPPQKNGHNKRNEGITNNLEEQSRNIVAAIAAQAKARAK